MGGGKSKPTETYSAELDKPWRNFNWGQKEALKEKLENFSSSNPDVNEIKIVVAGQIGAGKSSFINSIDSALQGQLKKVTMKNEEKDLPFAFKDVMGLEPQALAGSQPDDIIHVVFGHVKDGYKFKEDQAITSEDQHYIRDPTLSDQAFCLVYVIDAQTVKFTDDKLTDKLKIIRHRISDKGIPQVVVMTKVDEACPLVKKELRKIYTSKKIKDKMELCSIKTGVPLSNIFPVKNYHEEIDTEDDIDVLILKAFEQIVHVADARLGESGDY